MNKREEEEEEKNSLNNCIHYKFEINHKWKNKLRIKYVKHYN